MRRIFSKKYTNGARAIFIPDKNAPTVSIMALIAVGSRHEDQNQLGYAHFTEHVLFKGTKSYPTSKKIAVAIENMGGSTNAFTSYNYTGYYVKVPPKKIKEATAILSDMINNPLFPRQEVEKERGVIIEEIKMYEDLPTAKVDDIFNANLFGRHSLGLNIAGNIASIKNAKTEDLLKFKNQHYNSESIVYVISGNFVKTIAEVLIENAVFYIPKGKKPAIVKFKKHNSVKVINEHKDLEQTHIVIGGIGLPRNHKYSSALNVGNVILGRGFGSMLFQKMREELALAYYVHSHLSFYKETGKYQISMGVDNKKQKLAIDSVLLELEKVKNQKFSLEEVKRAKNFIIGMLSSRLETSDEIAIWYGLRRLLEHEILTPEEQIKSIKAVTPEEIAKAWSKVLVQENITIVTLGPKQKK